MNNNHVMSSLRIKLIHIVYLCVCPCICVYVQVCGVRLWTHLCADETLRPYLYWSNTLWHSIWGFLLTATLRYTLCRNNVVMLSVFWLSDRTLNISWTSVKSSFKISFIWSNCCFLLFFTKVNQTFEHIHYTVQHSLYLCMTKCIIYRPLLSME